MIITKSKSGKGDYTFINTVPFLRLYLYQNSNQYII